MESRKNAGVKKRKLPNDGTVQEQWPSTEEMRQAVKEMRSELLNLRDDNKQLREDLLGKELQLVKTRTLLVDMEHKLSNTQTLLKDMEHKLSNTQTLLDDIAAQKLADTQEFETEILRLKCLLAEKNDTNNYALVVSPEEIQKQTPVSPARTPVSNRTNTEDCCRRGVCSSGSGTDESSRSCVYHMLVESLVGMKFTLKDETEGLSVAIYHEATVIAGYDFSLTWLEQPDGGEWVYNWSSLGTLEVNSAKKWVTTQGVRFSMDMFSMFFNRISSLIKRGR
ncbi:uncharacterized protein LOC123406325 isoform X1 [Hordeum vulgare subsp. vulgare]|nr:uncharacterized protein LOC123406325 isoform X1 [Hordeum vulgare subsp. vulgare]